MKVKLSPKQIEEAMSSSNNKELMIEAECIGQNLFFTLGDGSKHRVPINIFQPSGKGKILPDFMKMKIIDYGQTLQLGDYEASVDAILEDLHKINKGSI